MDNVAHFLSHSCDIIDSKKHHFHLLTSPKLESILELFISRYPAIINGSDFLFPGGSESFKKKKKTSELDS